MNKLKRLDFLLLLAILVLGLAFSAGAETRTMKASATSDRVEDKMKAKGLARKTCSYRLQRECGGAVQNIQFGDVSYKEFFIDGKRLYKATVECQANCNK